MMADPELLIRVVGPASWAIVQAIAVHPLGRMLRHCWPLFIVYITWFVPEDQCPGALDQ